MQQPDNKLSFEKGVTESVNSNLLHSCFLVRTSDLLNKLTRQQNYYYLSGLLIGTELNDLNIRSSFTNFIIVGDATLSPYYTTALETLSSSDKNISIRSYNADEAIIRGQHKIYTNLKSF